MVSRRALLGAGALLLVGCGPTEEPEVNASEVWNESLRAAQVAAASYPRPDKAAAARVSVIEDAVRAAGGTPVAAPDASSLKPLAAEQAALRAHVAAVGLLSDAPSRELLAGLIAGTAAAQARLSELAISFPGQPANPR